MKNSKVRVKGNAAFRPLLIASAVGLACQTVVAQTAPDITTTPFANRPLHLQNDTSKAGVKRPKPNVMLYVDDSGSMLENVNPADPNRTIFPCTYNPQNLLIANNRTINRNGRCFNYPWGGLRWVRPGYETKMDSLINTLNELVDDYGDQINWNIQTLWGSEMRHMSGVQSSNPNDPGYKTYTIIPPSGAPGQHGQMVFPDGTRREISLMPVAGQMFRYIWRRNTNGRWNNNIHTFDPEVYMASTTPGVTGTAQGQGIGGTPPVHSKMMTADEIRVLIDNLNPQGTTPVTHRYLLAAETMRQNIEYRCQQSMIVVLSDGAGNNGMFNWPGGIYGTQPWWFPNQRHSGQIRTAGMAHFSGVLANTDLKSGGQDKEGGDWDDPNFKDQIITTHTIGFGLAGNTFATNYLIWGAEAGKGAFAAAQTPEELKTAFKNALQSVSPRVSAGAISANSTGAPATTSSSVAELAATLTLDTGNWSSELKFIKLDANAKPTNTTAEPDYSGRKVMVNNGNRVYWLNSTTPASMRSDFDIDTEEEFRNGFIPWVIRDNSQSDADIEARVSTIPLASRTVKKYRVRSPRAIDAARQMSDVVDTPIRAFGEDINGRQKFVVTAANDGMVYIFESETSSTASFPFSLKLNYLPAGMQRESADQRLTVGKSIRAIAEEGYGKDNLTQPHVYLNNGGISWAKTPSTGGFGQEYILLGSMGQGGRGSYALTIGGEQRNNSSATAIPAGLEGTDPLKSVPLWETAKGTSNQMGYTIGTGQIAQVATKWSNTSPRQLDITEGVRLYAFIANGYRSSDNSIPYDNSPTLYVYDMMGQDFGTKFTKSSGTSPVVGDSAGTLVTKISVGNDPVSGAPAGALSSPTLLDNNFDGVADFAYAGDQFGNLYRFDLREEPNTWSGKVKKIYRGDITQPITAAPALHRIDEDKYVVIFGTGSDIFDRDRTDINQQVILGIYDDLSVATPPILTATSSSILDQVLTTDNATGERRLSNNAFDPTLHKAWRIKLPAGKSDAAKKDVTAAERVVVRPEMLVGTAFLTSRAYEYKETSTSSLPKNADKQSTCYSAESRMSTTGYGWLMTIDAETGAGPDPKTKGHVKQTPSKADVIGTKIQGIPSTVIFASRQDGSQRLPSGALDYQGVISSLDNSKKGQETNDSCIPVEFDLTLGIQTSDPNAPFMTYDGNAPRCKVEMIRTNWREVPL